MPDTYKGFEYEAAVHEVDAREFLGTAVISKDGVVIRRETNEMTYPTAEEARTEAEIMAPNIIDALLDG